MKRKQVVEIESQELIDLIVDVVRERAGIDCGNAKIQFIADKGDKTDVVKHVTATVEFSIELR